jgi:ABC-type antimicrobial peptide transport system permease subunit
MIELAWQSLWFYWRRHVAGMLGVAVGGAVLTGALLVGDSVRGSLRQLALDRLGAIDHALVANRFFRQELAEELGAARDLVRECQPSILLRGTVSRVGPRGQDVSRAGRVNVVGVTPQFWRLAPEPGTPGNALHAARQAVLSNVVARELQVQVGDQIVVRVQTSSAVPRESVLGRKTDTLRSLPLQVEAIVADPHQFHRFSLEPNQQEPRNVFVPLDALQRTLDRPGQVNALLASTGDVRDGADRLNRWLAAHVQLGDVDLRLRTDSQRGYSSIESGRMILEPAAASAATDAARPLGVGAAPTLVQLALAIEKATGPVRGGAASPPVSIPYSTIAALDVSAAPPLGPLRLTNGSPAPAMGDDEILLNDWAADDLNVQPGDAIAVRYFTSQTTGELKEWEARFRLRGIVAMEGLAADPGLVPEYPGVTNARTLDDWDPPFPMDHRRIRRKDEDYWRRHRTTPKGFVSLAAGERLWASRFGQWTSVRLALDAGRPGATAKRYAAALRDQLVPSRFGLAFQPVKQRALAAAAGATDFAGLFLGFSFFLIASAVLLVGLLFRLAMERRARELGLLRAVGFAPRAIRRVFGLEGGIVAAVGGLFGSVAGLGFAWLMLAGLRTWWVDAVRTSELRLHVTGTSLFLGGLGAFSLACVAILWAIVRIYRVSPRALLAGGTVDRLGRLSGRGWGARATAAVSAVLAVAALLAGTAIARAQSAAFFASGTAMLVAALAMLRAALGRESDATVPGHGWAALARLGARNATRHPARSVLTAGLIASATFVIVAVGASRHDVSHVLPRRDSGDGGFSLVAESDAPLFHDLNSDAGRVALGLDRSPRVWDTVRVAPFRLRPGEDASCLNLYRPQQPRILGAAPEFIARGGFRVARSAATRDDERTNPWRLLEGDLPNGAVPAIGDANTLQWILHLGIGDRLPIATERGEDAQIEIVAALDRSLFQGELVIAERQFVRLFPNQAGYQFFLVETAPDRTAAVSQALEQGLRDFGFDAVTTAERLAEFRSVENTYMATFQTLGGLGLVLGTVGLGAVLLRGVLERQGELALLRAVGYTRTHLAWLVLAENLALLLLGVASGLGSALLAVGPHLWSGGADVSWSALLGTLGAVLSVGMLTSVLSVLATLRAPLLPALRGE